jgi:predicted methyltransferase
MYDQSKLSEMIRFARVEAGSTVIDVYPGDGEWTRLFSDAVGPEGRVYSFVPAEVAHFKVSANFGTRGGECFRLERSDALRRA